MYLPPGSRLQGRPVRQPRAGGPTRAARLDRACFVVMLATVSHAQDRPTFMAPPKAGEAIRVAIGGQPPATLTVADAAAKTGLALRDAENGLKWLSTEFRGQLRVTAGGELVYVFPTGFTK